MRKINLENQKFGKLVVIKRNGTKTNTDGSKKALWLCKCDCGNYTEVITNNLKSGKTKSCGCVRNKDKLKNLIGQKFGRLTVIKRDENSKTNHTMWICKCECGKVKRVGSSNLIRGTTLSCGCYKKEKISKIKRKYDKEKFNERIYNIWRGIKTRCYNKKSSAYKHYGGRGIKMCDEWLKDFESFYKWAIANGYDENLTIERVNVNGNYDQKNCKWITKSEQADNKTSSVKYEYEGEFYTCKQLSQKFNIDKNILKRRLNKYEIKEALDYKAE